MAGSKKVWVTGPFPVAVPPSPKYQFQLTIVLPFPNDASVNCAVNGEQPVVSFELKSAVGIGLTVIQVIGDVILSVPTIAVKVTAYFPGVLKRTFGLGLELEGGLTSGLVPPKFQYQLVPGGMGLVRF